MDLDQLIRDASRRRVQQEHPKLDEVAVDGIVEEILHIIYQLIPDACRSRAHQRHPTDEAAVDEFMKMIPDAANLVGGGPLAQRMHLPKRSGCSRLP
jgi:hypothetical protein